MRPSPVLLATSGLLACLGPLTPQQAQAEDIALSFDLPEAAHTAPASDSAPEPARVQLPEAASLDLPLPVPVAAANPPTTQSGLKLQAKVALGGGDSLAMAEQDSGAAALLPPPPPLPAEVVLTAGAVEAASPAIAPPPVEKPQPIALSFDIEPSTTAMASATAQLAPAETTATPAAEPLLSLFAGGSESLVARTVGSAEGTRTSDGQRTAAYFGHSDPGNGVWNLGTFSYQHGAASPEEADSRQLRRLKAQTEVLQQKALDHGITLSLQETLNGIDLANQAPVAAIGQGSYIDWLAEARKLQIEGDEAIVWARTRAFLDPDTQQWNAPGLGNNVHSISRDQERRMLAIAHALETYRAQHPEAVPETLAAIPLPAATPAPLPADTPQEAVDEVFRVDTTAPEASTATAAREPSELRIGPNLAPADAATADQPSPVTAAEATQEAAQINPPSTLETPATEPPLSFEQQPAEPRPAEPAGAATPKPMPEALVPQATADWPETMGAAPASSPAAAQPGTAPSALEAWLFSGQV